MFIVLNIVFGYEHDIFTQENYSLTRCLLFKKYLSEMISYFIGVYIIN